LALSVAGTQEAGIEYPELKALARAERGGISSRHLGSDMSFVQTVSSV